jgi:3-oxoacyl-(acyl-carrier-protein) synthase
VSRRVWITGAGSVTAAGVGNAALDDYLRDGNRAATGAAPTRAAPTNVAPTRDRAARHLDRASAFFYAAGREAWTGAGLDGVALCGERVAVIEGSSLGPAAELITRAQAPGRRARPHHLITMMTGAGGAALAQAFGAHGAVLHLSAGSVSATCAIGEAYQRIASGAADVVVAGGGEAPLHPEILAVFESAGILASSHGAECRPFDARRRGTMLGEGAGALVLESEAHARARGAVPRAIVSGFGLRCEAGSMVAPDPSGAGVSSAVRAALGDRDPASIGWIKAHGTGTVLNDAAEVAGLETVFGRRLADMPITSLKSALGHCLGASGSVEAVAALLALEGGYIPATAGFEQEDPALGCRPVRTVEQTQARSVLMISESFGGRCAAITMELP